jgi:hypothetical protein
MNNKEIGDALLVPTIILQDITAWDTTPDLTNQSHLIVAFQHLSPFLDKKIGKVAEFDLLLLS